MSSLTIEQKFGSGAAAVVLAMSALGLASCKRVEGPSAGTAQLSGEECNTATINLFKGEQILDLPTGCNARVTVYEGYQCTGSHTASPTTDTSGYGMKAYDEWDLRADPTIKGSNMGTTRVKCDLIQSETPITPEGPILLPTPTLAPTITPETGSISVTNEIANLSEPNVDVRLIILDNSPPDGDKLIEQLELYYKDGLGLTGIVPKGIKGIINPETGEVIGFSAKRVGSGKSIKFIRTLDNDYSPPKATWVAITAEVIQQNYKHTENDKLTWEAKKRDQQRLADASYQQARRSIHTKA